MEILSVQNLSKKYDKFTLHDVSFSLEKGSIMGFIGRNGAGKTTTLKSMLNLVHPDSGKVSVLGIDLAENEFEFRQKIGFVFGGVDYYPKKKLKVITDITKRFYKEWDDQVYSQCLSRFSLDTEKRVEELSAGMRVKYLIALALSHNARLLILDEPTSGLDPVSRDDLLEVFINLVEDGEKSILFSTHITSDLEKCADCITYIKEGKIIAKSDKDSFLDSYRMVKGTSEQLSDDLSRNLIGLRQHKNEFEGLIKAENLPYAKSADVSPADLESIMVHIERE